MTNDPNRRNADDTAAVPITGSTQRRSFNPLWYLLLLLIPLLLLPFCHHRDADRTAEVTPPPVTPAPTATAAGRGASIATANPFTVNTTGNDAGKAVLNFDVNTTTPNAAAIGTLNTVVAYLQANPSARVSLTGYTDNSGSADVNKQLTQKRVDTVKSGLTGAGIDAARITTANFGEAYPVTDNSSPQAREMNRRVEIALAK